MARRAAARFVEGKTSAPAPLTRPAPTGQAFGAPAPTAPPRADSPRRSSQPRSGGKRVEPAPLSIDRGDLEKAGGRERVNRLERKLREAARAFEDDRLDEALPKLRTLVAEAPSFAPAHELYGLTLYQQGRWADALRELELFATMTDTTEQHPVMADCHRALRHWDEVDRLWAELREASPSAELVTEGRIVTAGALADRGELAQAIALLSRSFDPPRRPRPFHLRRMYALADLHDRAGDLPRARDLFRRIAASDPTFFDAAERARQLG